MHVVLSSHYQVFFNPRVRNITDSICFRYSQYFGIKIYHRAIVGTHIHLIVLAKSDETLHGFLRVVTGVIAAKLLKLGLIPINYKKLWTSRPWSRVLCWGRSFTTAIRYTALNYLEGTKQIIRSQTSRRKSELAKHRCLIDEVLAKKLTKIGTICSK